MMANKGFYCLDGYLKRTAKLSDQELGRLFRACMVYHATGEVQELTGRESVAFDFIREDIDAANEAYTAKCEKNKENVSKRWSDTNVYDRIRPNTNEENPMPEDTNVSKVKEKENIKENVKGNIKDTKKRAQELDGFDEFWAAYPKKVKKPEAMKAWGKIKVDRSLIMTGLEKWKHSDQWTRDGGQYIPYPATWLNARQWEDEVHAARQGQMPAQQYEQRSYDGRSTDEAADEWLRNHSA